MLPLPFLKAKEIIMKLEEHGHQAYFVGGAVRDHLIGREIGDIDITTAAKPEMVTGIFPKVIPVGIEHGTVIVRHEEESFEVTTFRLEEGYSDYRHPDQVHFVDQVEADLARRDFTMNAVAMDKSGKLIDPYLGKSDIKAHCIRTVGNAEERFQEDPLRMMRAIRFCSQLGFSIESTTWDALCQNVRLMEQISVERIAKEMEKLFQGQNVQDGWNNLYTSGLFRHLPLLNKEDKLVADVRDIIQPLSTMSEIICLFYLLNTNVSIQSWVKEWKLSNQVKKEAAIVAKAINYAQSFEVDQWLVYRLPPSLHLSFVRLSRILLPDKAVSATKIQAVRERLPIRERRELAVTGNDLVHLFPDKKKGPWINELQQDIEKRVVLGCLPNMENEIKEWAKEWNPPESS